MKARTPTVPAVLSNPAGLMVGVSLLSWLATSAWVDTQTSRAVLYGMLGPLVVAVVASMSVDSIHRRNPGRLTGFLTAALGVKMVFFGVYVTIMLRGLSLPPVPFMASFTVYFITLHLIEALSLRRLFSS
jgi:hypothetical protein